MNNGQEIDSNQQSLKELVFEICENLYIKKEKITRNKVRELAGRGSDRDLSNYINEWKESKAMVHKPSENGTISPSNGTITPSTHGTEHGTEVQPHAENIDFTPQSDIKEIVRTGAEQAAGLLIAQNAIASHFYQNPEKLPEDLRNQVEVARANFSESRMQVNSQRYNSDSLIQAAMGMI